MIFNHPLSMTYVTCSLLSNCKIDGINPLSLVNISSLATLNQTFSQTNYSLLKRSVHLCKVYFALCTVK